MKDAEEGRGELEIQSEADGHHVSASWGKSRESRDRPSPAVRSSRTRSATVSLSRHSLGLCLLLRDGLS